MAVAIEHGMCMHCGACVGTCPVNALTLDETVVRVSDECIDCGICTRACPVGAIDEEG
jgi:NAD-dependent dihydropyrimidine dehydrogenase PreA subunit